MSDHRYLLIQIRDADDPIRLQEIECFATALECQQESIGTFDLLSTQLGSEHLDGYDMVVIGGSGRYSVTSEEAWLHQALRSLRFLLESGKPTFASCWGFQALARAAGGKVTHDLEHAELGTHRVFLTEQGRQDPIFSQLPDSMLTYMGHEDRVIELPPDAVLLASNDRVAQQAFRFEGCPVYCSQFHPELTLSTLLTRIEAYPEYCERIAKLPFEVFRQQCEPAPESESILQRFARHHLR
ncbi:type 1 glutamine amidotransferase [Blastopirellula marina]|uniref:Aminotransferase n=1 Tax=Blastopirellula marina TaxID=124 RepID=A0A2S8GTW0_9BACT|nr:type 1 glutamine amidotransferase [Blastopirellula marina]PQO47846.1 aminotransferase [Blastopirellula marina]